MSRTLYIWIVMILYLSWYVAIPITFLSTFFFFNDTATTEIYTLSLHDALPILDYSGFHKPAPSCPGLPRTSVDRKSTRLNSSHVSISYAVFCLKKKKNHLIDGHLH